MLHFNLYTMTMVYIVMTKIQIWLIRKMQKLNGVKLQLFMSVSFKLKSILVFQCKNKQRYTHDILSI